MVPVFARQESQVCRETLDPMGRKELRAHPAHKDPRDSAETKVTLENQEMKGPWAPRDLQVHWGRKGTRAPRDLLAHWEATGNSACLQILTMAGTLDWSR